MNLVHVWLGNPVWLLGVCVERRWRGVKASRPGFFHILLKPNTKELPVLKTPLLVQLYVSLGGGGAFVVAQTVGVPAVGMPSNWLNLGAFGVLGVSFIMVINWMMTRFTTTLDRQARAIDVLSAQMIGFSRQMLTHNLLSLGVDPSDTKEKRDAQAKRVVESHNEILKHLDEMQRTVLKGYKRSD